MLKRITYWDWLLIWFIAGTACGTLLINVWKPQFAGTPQMLSSLLLDMTAGPGGQDKTNLMLYVARQRLGRTILIVLVSVTSWSVPGFYFLAFYGGLSGSMILSMITCQKGLMGLVCYLATLFPQYLFYLLIWFILAGWASKQSHHVRMSAVLGIGVLLLAGICLETLVNPVIMNFFC
ncbi:hypothetical protein C0033_23510 [Clostridium sp. chh4-2]|uniref:stage II sporulation protein M n=1 Tax=Clostridium sp. chh4-2 TaxID=2067550 RepID=UPI000CCF0BE1|nr:stage II sporulation protein M [Clostridium sp. chh4-2]PNV59546.1 hypothetical protein C0033_23510 [Clostridium sp. chh4-2]